MLSGEYREITPPRQIVRTSLFEANSRMEQGMNQGYPRMDQLPKGFELALIMREPRPTTVPERLAVQTE